MRGYLLVAMLLVCQMLAAKDIEVSDSTYSYTKGVRGEKIRITEYTVRNMSDEQYLTWVDFSGRDETRRRRIFRYFHAPHGDMNLAMLMTDNVARESEDIILGVSFIKVLKPHGSFKYVVVNEKDGKDFRKGIVVEKASAVAKIIGFQVPETFSFAKDELAVPFCNSEFR